MNYKEICEIIKSVSDSSLSFAEIKTEDLYIKMEKTSSTKDKIREANECSSDKESLIVDEDKVEIAHEFEEEKDKDNIEVITSPLVGTFYRAPSPESDPYVEIGSHVKKGDVLCIIEAMKLMNEIEANVDGEIVEIMAQNGEMVEYGESLFKIRKAD
ncbi:MULTISPECIES: acetyl-CoA carboxylase biotin carboxyl carrier protein [Clostridium]|jgi:acetyl-CoA carboxylase biotin carboxyl carrier protein|uniref:Biotin carboxyl carrier protein of acetyl-CoA carboxylase n=2 Tax=Clostridium TaxID=1485 RepID=A0A151AN22_9CLOT|nr:MULTISPECIES: acetyl-CoA carboxylase biotin carboxyl carrier protein [Clostridium]KYH28960.1 biotin carboxyl carrier protein of acetyl-CoA carboxylase [Clostridium colicanis DSM 13634]MBE6044844.1 acetyl-CoA carboxylase biotin carboxyl carrier protein [Clostridium thermopalmarium]PRR73234.1 Biotin carboxyl carrier protein of acetyl-CoA carboxylase [Clostridium thermopalmarium DSM 5974]PVZ25202.1 acetyl-CoA carboxylase biotin carboxyl carrier protein [Clostridium thermopalmarium DSM 5974]